MSYKKEKLTQRVIRQKRVRKKIRGTPERPRLCVFRSSKHIYVQAIDDEAGATIATASTIEPSFMAPDEVKGKAPIAGVVGALIAKRLLAKNLKRVVFDRNGYLYHGRVKALAEAARQAGLEF